MRKIKRIVLGYSVLANYNQCETKFKYQHIENLTKPSTPDMTQGSPLSFGTYWHEFMEFYHNGRPAQECLDQVLGKASQTILASVYPEAKRSLLHLELLLNNYVKVFPNPYSDFRPYDKLEGKPAFEFEVQFVLSSDPLIIWRQRYDGIVYLPNGEIAILEHKTSSGDLRKDLRARMMPNAQAVGYVYGLRRVLEVPVTGVLFNGACTYRPLVNPDYKYRGKGEPQPLFLREFVKVEEWMLDEWLSATLRKVKRMIEDIEDNVYGNDAPNSCTIFNSTCKFRNLCLSEPLDRERLKRVHFENDTYEGFEIEFEDEK